MSTGSWATWPALAGRRRPARNYLQAFKAACPVDEYNSSRQVSSDSLRHNNGVGVMQQAQRVSRRCAFFLASEDTPGLIVESGPTQQLFDAPADPRTADYVHGRFG